MWSCAGEQRDTGTKVFHINLIEPTVWLFIFGRHGHYKHLSHTLRNQSFCSSFVKKPNVDVMKGRDEKGKDSSFVRWIVALPQSLLSVTELQSGFFSSF